MTSDEPSVTDFPSTESPAAPRAPKAPSAPKAQRLSSDKSQTKHIDDVVGDGRISRSLNKVFDFEGGYQQNPNDRGNFISHIAGDGENLGTNMGITPVTLAEWRNVDPSTITVEDMKNLTEEEATEIYTARYITDPGFDKLPDSLMDAAIDAGVLSGPGTAIILLRRAAGLPKSTKLDAAALEAVSKVTPDEFADARNAYYDKIKGAAKHWYVRSNSHRNDM